MAIRLSALYLASMKGYLIEMNRLPSASLEDVVPMSTQVEEIIKKHPEGSLGLL
ncbi:MAG: hypothetical protein U0894_11025 [Pirellulales bacterium]